MMFNIRFRQGNEKENSNDIGRFFKMVLENDQGLYLDRVNIEEFKKKSNGFLSTDFSRSDESEIAESFQEVFDFGMPLLRPMRMLKTKPGNKLYRIRKINIKKKEPEKETILLEDMNRYSDFWAPEKNYADLRLNEKDSPLLYVCPNPDTAMYEVRLKKDDIFVLIIYNVCEGLQTLPIMYDVMENYLKSNDRKVKAELLNSFLTSVFSKRVSGDANQIYKISRTILNCMFSGPDSFIDGWGYKSSVAPNGLSMAFKPTISREKMSIQGALLCVCTDFQDNRYSYGFARFCDNINESNENFEFKKPNTKEDQDFVQSLFQNPTEV